MKVKFIAGMIGQNRPGKVRLIPEEPEDIWISYNLISQSDVIRAVTTAKSQILRSSKAENGCRQRPKSVRVRLEVELKVIEIGYSKDSSSLRVRGKNLNPSDEASIGSFHSIELEINKPFDLSKISWDKSNLEKLREAEERPIGADIAVIIFQQRTAQLHLMGNRIASLCLEIQDSNSKKARGNKFFESIFNAFVKFVNLDSVKYVIIGSSDSVKDEFRQYLLSESQKKKSLALERIRSRILTAGITETNKFNIHELFDDPSVTNKIKDCKSGQEILAYKRFSDFLARNSDRICYGIKDVENAVESRAIETLLVTDDLVRFSDGATAAKYSRLVESVKKMGGEVCEYAIGHGYGEELAKMTGVAAILRFPLHYSSDDSLG